MTATAPQLFAIRAAAGRAARFVFAADRGELAARVARLGERSGAIVVRSRTGKLHMATPGGPQHCNTRYGGFSTSGALSVREVQAASPATFCAKCFGASFLAGLADVVELSEAEAASVPAAQPEPATCPDCNGTGDAPADRPAGVPPLCGTCKGDGTAAPIARRFRVVRGETVNGRTWATGSNYTAPDARAAVRADEYETRKAFTGSGPLGVFSGAKPHPVIAVYELVPVPAEVWRPE